MSYIRSEHSIYKDGQGKKKRSLCKSNTTKWTDSKTSFDFHKNEMSSFSKEDVAMFAPLGVIAIENNNE